MRQDHGVANLGQTYGLRSQIEVMFSDSFPFRKCKSCTQKTLLVLRLIFEVDLSDKVLESSKQ